MRHAETCRGKKLTGPAARGSVVHDNNVGPVGINLYFPHRDNK